MVDAWTITLSINRLDVWTGAQDSWSQNAIAAHLQGLNAGVVGGKNPVWSLSGGSKF